MKLPSILSVKMVASLLDADTISLDPGGTTGYLFVGKDRRKVFGELKGFHHNALWKLMSDKLTNATKNDPEAKLIILCEEFEYRKDAAAERREKIVYDSKEYIGIVKLFERTYPANVYLRMQTASMAKGFWDDDKLRKVGFHVSSKHERDAARHYLYYVTSTLKDQRYLMMLKPGEK